MNKEYSLTNSKELVELEKEIDSLDDIKDWTGKIEKMKTLKEKITSQKNKLNSMIDMINNAEVKKISKKKKDMSLDELLKEYNKTDDIEEKVKLFTLIQSVVKEAESELFD